MGQSSSVCAHAGASPAGGSTHVRTAWSSSTCTPAALPPCPCDQMAARRLRGGVLRVSRHCMATQRALRLGLLRRHRLLLGAPRAPQAQAAFALTTAVCALRGRGGRIAVLIRAAWSIITLPGQLQCAGERRRTAAGAPVAAELAAPLSGRARRAALLPIRPSNDARVRLK